MFSRGSASSLTRNSFGLTTGESIWDFYFPEGWFIWGFFWNHVVRLIIDCSALLSSSWDQTCLAFILNCWLIPLSLQKKYYREKLWKKHLLLCLKLLLVVLVTINLWGDLSSYCMNRRCKLRNRIQKREKIENPPTKEHILFQAFLTPYYSPWSLRW